MTNIVEQWVVVATGLNETLANELVLVLIAREVPHRRELKAEGVELSVPLASVPVATTELTLYSHENRKAIGQRPLEEVGGGGLGVIAYAATLCLVFIALYVDPFNRDWLGAGRLEAGAVLAGEWWRLVTALTLHLELAHLGGNLVFGAFFGYFVGRYLGAGVGWLAVLVAGAMGNGLNSIVQAATHRSIGASTAVFAALGLLAAYTWKRGFLRDTPWRARIGPITAAIGLLAFTGTAGENTDLGAHLFGFIAGIAGGVALARLVRFKWLRNPGVQWAAGAAALAVVIGAWLVGFAAGR